MLALNKYGSNCFRIQLSLCTPFWVWMLVPKWRWQLTRFSWGNYHRLTVNSVAGSNPTRMCVFPRYSDSRRLAKGWSAVHTSHMKRRLPQNYLCLIRPGCIIHMRKKEKNLLVFGLLLMSEGHGGEYYFWAVLQEFQVIHTPDLNQRKEVAKK
jgi:hypothetical protein